MARWMTLLLTLTLAAGAIAAEPASSPTTQPAGIAAGYPGDAGIARDPRVLFADNFETGTLEQVAKRWGEMKAGKKEPRAVALVDDQVAPGSTRSLRITATLERDTGGHLYHVLKPGADRLHARYYLRFADDAPYIHHFVSMGGLRDAPPWPVGEAGLLPDGRRRFISGLEPWGRWGKVPPPGAWHFYTYWHKMKKSGDGKYWGNSFAPPDPEPIPRGRWMCVEQMIQANSAPNKADGEQAFWIDGKLIARFKGIHWRTANDLKVNFFWLSLYVTENAARQNKVKEPNPVCKVWFDDVVLATDYIGPKATRPAPTTQPEAAGPSRPDP